MLLLFSVHASATTDALDDAVKSALETNPTFLAAQAAVSEAESKLNAAYSARNPSFRLESEAGIAQTSQKSKTGVTSFGSSGGQFATTSGNTGGGSRVIGQKVRPRTGKAIIEQPLYKGGRISAGIDKACHELRAIEAQAYSIKSTLVQNVARAYLDVVLAQTRLELQQKTEQVLRHHLDAARLNLNIGSMTRTDVAQAESRFAGAHADRLQAQSGLKEAQVNFEKLVGYTPSRLSFPDITFDLPPSLEDAIRQAECTNPDLIQARFTEQASAASLREVRGELLPSVSLRGETGQNNDQFFKHIRTRNSGVYANLSIPLYSGGSTRNRIKAARHARKQKNFQTEEKRRDIRARVTSAFENIAVQKAKIDARKTEVQAARLALEGLTLEQKQGSRSLLDVLDGEKEALTAQLNYITAQADYIDAGYELMKLLGQLSA